MKRLHDRVTVHPIDGPRVQGYPAADGRPVAVPGSDAQVVHLHQIYCLSDATYTGRSTVPMLWDAGRCRVVNNESADIIDMFDRGFGRPDTAIDDGPPPPDLCPAAHEAEIEALDARIHGALNNGVYLAGYARDQAAYEAAAGGVCHARRPGSPAADPPVPDRQHPPAIGLAAVSTLFRFDAIYYGLFKCNLRPLAAYPALSGYLRDLYATPGIRQWCRLDRAVHGYYADPAVNPTGTIPIGLGSDLDTPHDRDHLGPRGDGPAMAAAAAMAGRHDAAILAG
ncbi:glutathione S-transferase family protein [Tistrella bauzanensis]